MEPNQPTPPVTENNSGTVSISVNKLSSIPFLLGVLLFLAPFIDIRCNNVSLQQVSGVSLATGFEVKTNNENSLFNNLKVRDDDFSFKKGEKTRGNAYALLALIIGLAGGIALLLKFKSREVIGVIAGIGAVAALIGLMIDIKSQVKLDLSARTDFADISLVIAFTPWFYLAVIAFLIGAFLSYRMINAKKV
jgi:hypothetical protein